MSAAETGKSDQATSWRLYCRSLLALCLCLWLGAEAKADEAPAINTQQTEALGEVMRQLSDLGHPLSVDGLDRAHQVQARLELLDQLETKLLEIAKKRQDRQLIEARDRAGKNTEPEAKSWSDPDTDPHVVDIIGQGRDLTARLMTGTRSTFAVKVGAKLGPYRVEAISAVHGVEVIDAAGRHHNLPEIEEGEPLSQPIPAYPGPPPGVVPGSARR